MTAARADGLRFARIESLNVEPAFIGALAEVARATLARTRSGTEPAAPASVG
jgi:protoheme ferro-lyase